MILEKDLFTKSRLDQLKYNPDLLSTEQWGKYCCVPLDIPRYDYPELVDWYFTLAKPISKLKPDVANQSYGVSSFDSVDVFVRGKIQNSVWSVNPQHDFLTLFPQVVERLYKDFPFKNINRLNIWSSNRRISYHRDQTEFVDYPGSFRIMLHDNNPVQTLNLGEVLPDASANEAFRKFFIPRLSDTNSFVWNNLRTKHGSFFLPSFRKILLIIKYDLDVEKYHELMERSVNKYRDNILISKKMLGDFVHE
jgi:hypothetical protein